MTRESAIAAQELTRRFGEHLAVDQVSFDVVRGEVFGFLGPNGAGKTTTARMLTGFVSPSSGRALVWGYDLARQASLARRHIGVVPEEANVYAELTVWQNVMLMAELHGLARGQRTAQAHALLERFGLADRARQNGRELSKGLRQRLMLCMALVSGPDLLFLDEPTSGLDVASTHLIRDIITETNRGDGTTVFLTTHNMEEADQLCHRVAIMSRGRLAAIDTPAALRRHVSARRSVEVRFVEARVDPGRVFAPMAGEDVVVVANGFRVFGPEPGRLAQDIVQGASALGLHIESIRTLEPTLEEVFLSITKTGARVAAADCASSSKP